MRAVSRYVPEANGPLSPQRSHSAPARASTSWEWNDPGRPSGSGTRGEDPHQLRGRLRPDLGPRVRQVVLDGGVRQAEPVGGRLLGPSLEDRRHDADLALGGALGGRPVGPGPRPHAVRPAAASHSSRPSIGISQVANARPTPVGRAAAPRGPPVGRGRLGPPACCRLTSGNPADGRTDALQVAVWMSCNMPSETLTLPIGGPRLAGMHDRARVIDAQLAGAIEAVGAAVLEGSRAAPARPCQPEPARDQWKGPGVRWIAHVGLAWAVTCARAPRGARGTEGARRHWRDRDRATAGKETARWNGLPVSTPTRIGSPVPG